MSKLFGFSIEDTEPLSPGAVSPIPQNNEDGVDHFASSGFFGSYVDLEGVYRTEFELIKRYREMALHPECDSAIEDIVNEAIVSDTNDSPIEIELSNLNASDGIKKKIRALESRDETFHRFVRSSTNYLINDTLIRMTRESNRNRQVQCRSNML